VMSERIMYSGKVVHFREFLRKCLGERAELV
jgi:hypothetical protein